ncbi:ArsC/Spx/MgsR family protein [Pseudoruegeria sp. HB172150]|uniref:ArsC/Spx/MgsR family protein n=1 Tax=Pseudoruegeria sp. HB172150 TaxID=2721164 RepID=UPI0015528460|nr:ArsC/Spx/MgsR family protein [Pseudoruegeria sp. HB172150]
MRFFGLKTCDTCRKAEKALRAAGYKASVIDVRVDGVSGEDLKRFLDAFGSDLLNRRSTTWRGLSEEDRAKDPLVLLREHPTLMKRPVIESDGKLYLGWGGDVRSALLG